MLIKRILDINKVENYYFAYYKDNSLLSISLFLKMDNGKFKNLFLKDEVEEKDLTQMRALTSYAEVKEDEISINKARKLFSKFENKYFEDVKIKNV